MSFEEWKAEQVELGNLEKSTRPSNSKCHPWCWDKGWSIKYVRHTNHANEKGVGTELSMEDFLLKCFEAGLTSPDQIGNRRGQYHLGRIGDVGAYAVESCRFITIEENLKEKSNATIRGKHSPRFIGYFHTPKGVFETGDAAAEANGCSVTAIHTRCKRADDVIHSKSKMDKEFIGKTYREIGYHFEGVS